MIRKTVFLFLCFVLVFSLQFSSLAQMRFGSLSVISGNDQAEIYIDGGLAGEGVVTIGKIAVGSHNVEVRVKGRVVYEKMVMVSEGQQTTLKVRPGTGPKPSGKRPDLGLELNATYGGYGVSYTLGNQSYSMPGVTNAVFGLGLGIRKYISQDMYASLGYHYNAAVSSAQLSYAYLNLGAGHQLFWEIGLNVPQITFNGVSSSSLNGSLGYQVALGVNLGDHLSIGARYSLLNFFVSSTKISVSQTAALIQIH